MENSQQTAFLIMDVQPGIVDRLPDKDGYLKHLQMAVDAARKKQLLVIYVVVGFRPGYPEVSENNKSFAAIKDRMPAITADPQPALPLVAGDIVAVKRRVSAFSGSDLEVILRARNVRHLVLTGIATSGVVLSTVREAADKDYQLTVLTDLCADFDPEVHTLLVGKVFPRQAEVMTAQEWMQQ